MHEECVQEESVYKYMRACTSTRERVQVHEESVCARRACARKKSERKKKGCMTVVVEKVRGRGRVLGCSFEKFCKVFVESRGVGGRGCLSRTCALAERVLAGMRCARNTSDHHHHMYHII